MHFTEYALIVAGGKGTRLPGTVPKQFLELNGLPVLMHTINAFYKYAENIKVILVLAADDFDTWHSLCAKFDYHKPISLQPGGLTRFQSVKSGLKGIDGDAIVAIHDGVRPLVTPAIIKASFELAKEDQSAVAAVPLKESIRQVDKIKSKSLDRELYRLIQTPQTFQLKLIKGAYELPEDETLTDDASIAERAGYRISLFEGSYENIKITTAEDLLVVEALLKSRQSQETDTK